MDIESSALLAQRAVVVNPAAKQLAGDVPQRVSKSAQDTRKDDSNIIVKRQVDANVYAKAERFSQAKKAFYDQPNPQSQQALNVYQQLQSAHEKDHIRSVLGVDTFV